MTLVGGYRQQNRCHNLSVILMIVHEFATLPPHEGCGILCFLFEAANLRVVLFLDTCSSL